MKDQVLLVEKNKGVAVVTLNRPEKANCLNHELKVAITRTMGELGDDETVGAIVLRSAGKHFCAGQDFNEVVQGYDYTHLDKYRKIFGRDVTDMFEKIITIGTPVIAAARGMITGEGFPLCASCDLIVASENTIFQFPGTNLGGSSIGPAVVAARYMGIKKALEYFFTGEPITAEVALHYGLINRIVPDDKVEHEAMKLAEKIAGSTLRNPAALKELGKATFYMALDMERSTAFRYAHTQLAQQFITAPVVDGARQLLNGEVSLNDRQLGSVSMFKPKG